MDNRAAGDAVPAGCDNGRPGVISNNRMNVVAANDLGYAMYPAVTRTTSASPNSSANFLASWAATERIAETARAASRVQ